jgi:hypothetical protein
LNVYPEIGNFSHLGELNFRKLGVQQNSILVGTAADGGRQFVGGALDFAQVFVPGERLNSYDFPVYPNQPICQSANF